MQVIRDDWAIATVVSVQTEQRREYKKTVDVCSGEVAVGVSIDFGEGAHVKMRATVLARVACLRLIWGRSQKLNWKADDEQKASRRK